jgi:hypothetical protein
VNGVEPNPTGKQKLAATRENVVNGWLATEAALREQGLNQEADQVVAFIQSLPPIKTDHDLLKEKIVADKVRLHAALNMKPATLDKAITPGDDLTLTR